MAFMVGAQLLNEAYQKEFSHTEKRVIFLPGCMTAHEKGKCQIKESHGAYKCQGCTKDAVSIKFSKSLVYFKRRQ